MRMAQWMLSKSQLPSSSAQGNADYNFLKEIMVLFHHGSYSQA